MLPSDIQTLLKEIKEPYVVLLIGLPLSGKDTFLKSLDIDNELIVSRDALIIQEANGLDYNLAYRQIPSKKIDKLFYQQIRLRAENKQTVFINITHLTKKKRARSIQYFKPTHKIIGIQFPVLSIDEFRSRNKIRSENESKYISEKVYLELSELYEQPSVEEGYDILILVENN